MVSPIHKSKRSSQHSLVKWSALVLNDKVQRLLPSACHVTNCAHAYKIIKMATNCRTSALCIAFEFRFIVMKMLCCRGPAR